MDAPSNRFWTASALVAAACLCSQAGAAMSTNGSNFNGTAIAAGDTIWFNAVFNASGLGSNPATLFVRNATITFNNGSTPVAVTVPDSDIVLSPSTSNATATFGTAWAVHVNPGSSGSEFLGGVAYTSPGLSGGINPVTWSADFSTDTPGLSLSWKWGAAVYTAFSADYNALGVKPIDANNGSAYLNSDHAGTPENYKDFVTGGARGGGGSNFTGSYSGTVSVTPTLVPSAGPLAVLGLGGLLVARRRRNG